MNEDEEGDKEVGQAVEDDVVCHTELGEVSPTPAVSLCCVPLHLKQTVLHKFECFTGGKAVKEIQCPNFPRPNTCSDPPHNLC